MPYTIQSIDETCPIRCSEQEIESEAEALEAFDYHCKMSNGTQGRNSGNRIVLLKDGCEVSSFTGTGRTRS